MSARLLHVSIDRFFGEVKTVQIFFVLSNLSFGFAQTYAAPPAVEDTTGPNQFAFSSDVYFVDKCATNAVINVDFNPGNRGWSGSVDFCTSNGTAQAGVDYKPASGTLSFSGPGTPVPVVSVPILKNDTHTTNVTVKLYLSNPNAEITRSHATVVIVDKNQNPSLQLLPNAYGMVIRWPAIYDGFVLEKSSSFSGDSWSAVASTPITNHNYCVVTDSFGETPAFYRLRKIATP